MNTSDLVKDLLKRYNPEFNDYSDYIIQFPQIKSSTYYPGAYVQNPIPEPENQQRYTLATVAKNVVDMDAKSLYPTIIINTNVSIETAVYLIPEIIAHNLLNYFFVSHLEFSRQEIKKFNVSIKTFLDVFNTIKKKLIFGLKNKSIQTDSEMEKELLKDYIQFIKSQLKDFNSLPKYTFKTEKQNWNSDIKSFLENYLKDKQYILVFEFKTNTFKFYDSADKFWNDIVYKELLVKKRILLPTGLIVKTPTEQESFLRVLAKIPVRLRDKVKKSMKNYEPNSPEYIKLEKQQLTFKLIANGLYGFTGYKHSPIFNNLISSSITTQGELVIKTASFMTTYLLKTMERISKTFKANVQKMVSKQ